ncbi:MAG: class I mannose-6-phosphate isomerase [Cyclobacteriaceae bacterium]|nr:class I mannose-6-phosphate isomerase [Cyclobacteriaceae bacterium]
MLYPLKFHPIYKEKIWGGNKIKTFLKKDFSPLIHCGESWEISGVKGNISVVREGGLMGKDLKSIISVYRDELIGNRVYHKFRDEFPLLIKFIDAKDDLSIQVHPDDLLAGLRHDSFGKTEMWYILQADEGASLIAGFNRPVNKKMYMDYFNRGRLMEILNRENVKAKDTFFIPAGRVHTIGTGLLLAEIQQTSDITYRIYDFDRENEEGKKRELHVEEALDAIDFRFHESYKTSYEERINEPVELAACKYFTTNKLIINKQLKRSYEDLDSFVILICTEGEGVLEYDQREYPLSLGEVVMIPSCINRISMDSDRMEVLEAYVTPETQ